jgi:hypothetical protein
MFLLKIKKDPLSMTMKDIEITMGLVDSLINKEFIYSPIVSFYDRGGVRKKSITPEDVEYIEKQFSSSWTITYDPATVKSWEATPPSGLYKGYVSFFSYDALWTYRHFGSGALIDPSDEILKVSEGYRYFDLKELAKTYSAVRPLSKDCEVECGYELCRGTVKIDRRIYDLIKNDKATLEKYKNKKKRFFCCDDHSNLCIAIGKATLCDILDLVFISGWQNKLLGSDNRIGDSYMANSSISWMGEELYIVDLIAGLRRPDVSKKFNCSFSPYSFLSEVKQTLMEIKVLKQRATTS